jgi:hypothetical protein
VQVTKWAQDKINYAGKAKFQTDLKFGQKNGGDAHCDKDGEMPGIKQ